MKNKETLGEAAEKSAIEQMEAGNSAYILGFIQGVKHQQEQDKNLYSEEDLLKFGAFVRIEDRKEKRLFLIQDYYNKWFNQFKKK